jgi:SAM-dependent methyltransferase
MGRDLEKAALCGEPSYIWRAGQERRLKMILEAGGKRIRGKVLDNGCGVGTYITHMAKYDGFVLGLEFDMARATEAHQQSKHILSAASEYLPFPSDSFDLILSNEVIEHVTDDHAAVREMVRTLRPGGRIMLYCPNVGYPFETHGVYWRGHYHFGNIFLINYSPRYWRNKLAPHVRIYSKRGVERLFDGLPVKYIQRGVVFGAYDNIIARYPRIGKLLRSLLHFLERTPFQYFGLSHFWVVEKTP